MTEVDAIALQLITAVRLATSATPVGPAAGSAADGGGADGIYVAAIVDVTGVGSPSLFRRYKTNAVGLIIETAMYGKWQRVVSFNVFHSAEKCHLRHASY
jgi:hypothetical protein